MLLLPTGFPGPIPAFSPLFVHRSWSYAQILLVGAILMPGRRTLQVTVDRWDSASDSDGVQRAR